MKNNNNNLGEMSRQDSLGEKQVMQKLKGMEGGSWVGKKTESYTPAYI